MLEKTGVPTKEELEKAIPKKERLEKGPVAVVECFQSIPCDPCQYACNRGAIKEFVDINDTPAVESDKCNGCGVCISMCPGLAVFVVDATHSETEAMVKIPYEFFPLPEEGDVVTALNREGEEIGQVKVSKVQNSKSQDKTPVIWLEVPKEFMMDVRNIRLKGGADA